MDLEGRAPAPTRTHLLPSRFVAKRIASARAVMYAPAKGSGIVAPAYAYPFSLDSLFTNSPGVRSQQRVRPLHSDAGFAMQSSYLRNLSCFHTWTSSWMERAGGKVRLLMMRQSQLATWLRDDLHPSLFRESQRFKDSDNRRRLIFGVPHGTPEFSPVLEKVF